jgi:hypothetical protein
MASLIWFSRPSANPAARPKIDWLATPPEFDYYLLRQSRCGAA